MEHAVRHRAADHALFLTISPDWQKNLFTCIDGQYGCPVGRGGVINCDGTGADHFPTTIKPRQIYSRVLNFGEPQQDWCDVMLPAPVELAAGKTYCIGGVARTGRSIACGRDGGASVVKIQSGGELHFSKARNSANGTGIDSGQICHIVYSTV
eukprot:COSAG02_NODE_525_length_20713_cov_5.808286_7_plen_153_part_00